MLGLNFNSNLGLQFPQPSLTGLMGPLGGGLTPPNGALSQLPQQAVMPFNPQLLAMALGLARTGQMQQAPQSTAPMMPMQQVQPQMSGMQFPQMSYARFPHGLY